VNSLHACALAQPSRAGLAGPSPAHMGWLGPAQPKKKQKKNRKCRNKNFACLRKNVFLSIYSLKSESRIKKEKRKYPDFLVTTNFYQRQSWNYSGSNIHWRQSQEYYKQIILA